MSKKPSHGALLQAENQEIMAEQANGVVKYKKPTVHPHKPTYDKLIADQICEIVASGQTVTGASRIVGIAPESVFRWAQKDYDGFAERLQQAKEVAVEHLVDEIIEIADDSSNDVTVDNKGIQRVDYEVINRSKLRIETRKWIASIVNPKKYGEKLQVKNDTTLRTVSDEPQGSTIELAKEEWTSSYANGKH